MGQLSQETQERSNENQARDKAIMAFLNLGERLKSFYNRETVPRQNKSENPFETENSMGASALFNTIEGEIIPRLMLAHKQNEAFADTAEYVQADSGIGLSKKEHEAFLQCIMQDSASAAHDFVNGLLQRGIPRETLFLELLATAARRLGELWEEDVCDFTEVTIGLCRLHEILRKNSILYNEGTYGKRPADDESRILLATACGDQHVFGVVMVAEFFRLAGWRVWSEPGSSREELAEILKSGDFDVLGLSVMCSTPVERIAGEISALRAASRNKSIQIIVGGRLFSEAPELVEQVGADAVASDAKSAPAIGEELLAAARSGC
ncbi:MAG: cobalamin B12-binding domain-containing protein [Pseudomonadota bacterium]